MKKIAVRSPSSSLIKFKSALETKGARMSKSTISRRLCKVFQFPSRKPAAKPKLTPAMKKKRPNFANKYKRWTADYWSKVRLSNESTLIQLKSQWQHVRRPTGKRYIDLYTFMTKKHPPSQISRGAMSVIGTASLYFLEKKPLLMEKNADRSLRINWSCTWVFITAQFVRMMIHHLIDKREWQSFETKVAELDWPGNHPDLNQIKIFELYRRKK